MIEVRVPKWGLTIESVTLTTWYVAIGQQISDGQPLCSIESDKSDTDIEAPAAGTVVALLADEGDECIVGQPILLLEPQ